MKLYRLCSRCGEDKPHSPRADRPEKPRAWCDDCTSEYLRSWRKKNWQRRKARDTWKGMIARCSDRRRDRYAHADQVPLFSDYGARGIKVCRRWSGPDGFARFIRDMGFPPTPEHTLDRIRCSRGYSPSNCRWADRKTQDENRSNTRWVRARNPESGVIEVRCVSDWGRVTGLDRRTISRRLDRGWGPDRAVSEGRPGSTDVPF